VLTAGLQRAHGPCDPLQTVVYARHGRELMGCKSPMCEPDRSTIVRSKH
jgi:hypothetical protein